ncbi:MULTISPECIES: dTDP-4-dehydrorhamnose 3,5-epimerase [Actinosynnema]|uniref:dTDP-4-dehydrorhamnose 3,5-epimerase n=1 Tax=Actinosynnema pretiosum TaxID=42197 RepID=A0A290Z2X1_9PSEU|nr:dTDP-4-dehydrorhamnose 3,5-epimerase [Actinosynnema pretiosum]ATE53347.1 dTDP-4-dehydrorhamnose 3,5-epimerase [Actinosynnema pretiosum]
MSGVVTPKQGMDMTVTPTEIDGVRVVQPEWFEDERGFFFESYSKRRWEQHGLHLDFVQDNHSRSSRGVLRGLHFQTGLAPQHRLVRCTAGAIWDVVVDIRVGSPTFGKWFGIELSATNRTQLLMGPGFAHGFAVLSDVAEVQYKTTGFHTPEAEGLLAWDDPDVGIPWPVEDPTLSAKDSANPSLAAYLENPAFHHGVEA